jgi:hypothetical protein
MRCWLTVVLVTLTLATRVAGEDDEPTDLERARIAIAEVRSPDIVDGSAEILDQLPRPAVITAILELLDAESGQLQTQLEIATAELTGRERFLVSLLGRFGGPPASMRHLDLLGRALREPTIYRHALRGINQLDKRSALYGPAMARSFESLLVLVERSLGGQADRKLSAQIRAVMRPLERHNDTTALESLARELIATPQLPEAVRHEGVELTLKRGEQPGALLERCRAAGLEASFWSTLGRRMRSLHACEAHSIWANSANADLHAAYDAYLQDQLERAVVTSSDLWVLTVLIIADCEGEPLAVPTPTSSSDGRLLSVEEFGERFVGTERDLERAQGIWAQLIERSTPR